MPINIRKDGDPLGGNRITLMRFKVPVGLTDPSERMAETHRRCESVKTDRSLPYTNAIAGTLNLLPRAYIGGMLRHVDFLASNVPGIPVPLYLTGAKVERFYGFGPTIGAAINVTLMSYCGTCYVAVNVDTGAVPDPDVLMDCLREGFDEVLAVGGGHRARRLADLTGRTREEQHLHLGEPGIENEPLVRQTRDHALDRFLPDPVRVDLEADRAHRRGQRRRQQLGLTALDVDEQVGGASLLELTQERPRGDDDLPCAGAREQAAPPEVLAHVEAALRLPVIRQHRVDSHGLMTIQRGRPRRRPREFRISLDRGHVHVAHDLTRNRRRDADRRSDLEIAVARAQRCPQHLRLVLLVAAVVQRAHDRAGPARVDRHRDTVHADPPWTTNEAVLDDETAGKRRGERTPHRSED